METRISPFVEGGRSLYQEYFKADSGDTKRPRKDGTSEWWVSFCCVAASLSGSLIGE